MNTTSQRGSPIEDLINEIQKQAQHQIASDHAELKSDDPAQDNPIYMLQFQSEADSTTAPEGFKQKLSFFFTHTFAPTRKFYRLFKWLFKLPKGKLVPYASVLQDDPTVKALTLSMKQMEGMLNIQAEKIRLLDEFIKMPTQIISRIKDLEEQINHPATEKHGSGLPNKKAEEQLFDSLYLALENRFRGSADNITERLREYLPIVHGLKNQSHSAFKAIDFGCGRGEWLRLLESEGLAATGVDQNPKMVSLCQSLNLHVVSADIFSYLELLPHESVDLITAFHVIEHLPHEQILRLCHQAFRVLKPGGGIILETPNPENVLMGSCHFYTDPTHIKPLPPALTNFFVDQCGFSRSKIMRLSHARKLSSSPLLLLEEKQKDTMTKRVNEIIDLLNRLFFAPADYAVVAYKDADQPKE